MSSSQNGRKVCRPHAPLGRPPAGQREGVDQRGSPGLLTFPRSQQAILGLGPASSPLSVNLQTRAPAQAPTSVGMESCIWLSVLTAEL